ncbi:MAG: hypothetical protein EP306_13925 [Burkholderiales bacterium]|nr:MAG: hypothetical protein EP306_13925 [Burkholderiales bacterium]
MLKNLPRKTLLSLGLAAAVLGISATATAQGGTTPEAPQAGEMTRMGMMHRHPQQREHLQAQRAERLEQLKADLKLTPEQEPAWLAFVARTGPQAPAQAADPAEWSKLGTPQRLDRMQALHEARSAAMKQRIDATRSFYAALSDEQKQVFDQRASGGLMRTGMHGGHRMGMRGEPGKAGHPGGHMHRHDHGMGGMPCQSLS